MPRHRQDPDNFFFGGIRDLSKVGIHCLTGEACAIMLRLSCDVTEQGRRIICKTLDLPANTKFAESWNAGHNDDPHVGCISLVHDMWSYFAIIACFAECPDLNCVFVQSDDNKCVRQVYAITNKRLAAQPTLIEELTEVYPYNRTFRIPDNGRTRGLENVHQMTGSVGSEEKDLRGLAKEIGKE